MASVNAGPIVNALDLLFLTDFGFLNSLRSLVASLYMMESAFLTQT